MPLQKLPPNGPLSVSASLSQRPQLHNRRRTLQTISELSTHEATLPDFVSSIGIESIRRLGHENVPGVGRSTPRPVKRQSLPQHHSSPNIYAPRSLATNGPTHNQGESSSRAVQGRRPMPITSDQVEGWNAKRERARLQHELAIAEARERRSGSGSAIPTALSTSLDQLRASSLHSSIRYTPNQQMSSEENKSCSCLAAQVERRASLGSTSNNTSQYDASHAVFERASTDSSSYQSRDSAMHRSRSGSSNTSYTSQDAPPLPHGTTPEIRGYCAELILQNQNLVAFGESARSKNLNPHRSSRTLPTDRSKHASAPHRYVTAPDLRQLPTQQTRPMSAQRARNQALAALTAANSHMQTSKNPRDIAHSSHQNRHASLTSHPPNISAHRTSLRSNASHHCLTLPPAVQPTMTSPRLTAQPPQRRHSDAPRRVSFETRTVPKRESLTQWKKEREEARSNLQTDHKARMQERVRRANELELEREKELVLMGKRRGKGETGCFGGLLEVFRGRTRSR